MPALQGAGEWAHTGQVAGGMPHSGWVESSQIRGFDALSCRLLLSSQQRPYCTQDARPESAKVLQLSPPPVQQEDREGRIPLPPS